MRSQTTKKKKKKGMGKLKNHKVQNYLKVQYLANDQKNIF